MSASRYERLNTENQEDGVYPNNEEEIEFQNEVHTPQIGSNVPSPTTRSTNKVANIAIGSLALILLYLSLSICLTFYQGRLLKKFKFPLSIVTYHLVFKFILSVCVRYIYKIATGKPRILLDFRTSLKKMAPTGFASGIDIGFSNWGLEIVKISLYTMTKSSSIIFILLFAILLGLEKKSWSLVLIVGMIATGLFLFTYKSTQFDMLGFTFLLIASFTSGIRWSFAQLIMQKSKLGLHNPIDMIFHMQPWMILSILPFTIGFEGKRLLEDFALMPEAQSGELPYMITKITIGAVLAFLMEISEFLVLSHTSSLTLSIAGIFKDMCQVVLAVELNGDQLSLMNILGLTICLGGICCHIIHKYSTLTLPKQDDGLFEDDDEAHPHVNSILNQNAIQSVKFHKNARQNVPLLDSHLMNSDSDDSNNENEQNASEVIFDVLKRRDATR